MLNPQTIRTIRRTATGRRWREMTQAELADMSGISQQMISDIERGDKSPSERTRKALAKALRVPVTLIKFPESTR